MSQSSYLDNYFLSERYVPIFKATYSLQFPKPHEREDDESQPLYEGIHSIMSKLHAKHFL